MSKSKRTRPFKVCWKTNSTPAHWFDLGHAFAGGHGVDDAAPARWVPIAELSEMEALFIEDHFNMLDRRFS
jgi:hypothetical protein